MVTLHSFIYHIMHLDESLLTFVTEYGMWAYGVLFAIIFIETGLVIFPFLPGDSLLFAAGALAAKSDGAFNIHILFVTLTIASILGNSVNYLIGYLVGPKVFRSTTSIFFNKKYLQQAHAFYEKHGGKTIILARFIPIIRTFGPFVAGIGYMGWKKFFAYNVVGAVLWIGSLLYVSYLFGNIPAVQEHFSLIILGVIILSILPAGIEIIRRNFCKSS